jgi:DNA-binding NarL/FixJ family response regulator
MSTATVIRVAIIEDDPSTRDGLGLLIDASPGYQCVGKFGSVEEALRRLGGGAADVLLLDINLPGMPGSEGVKLLREKYPPVQVLMLTVYTEKERVFESICNGACGYLLKKTPPVKLLEAISEAHGGGAPMTPEIARKVVTLFHRMGPGERLNEKFAPQEVKLLEFLAQGYSYQGCANRLNISINTVRDYIRSIYEKLHVHTKSEAVSKALRNRLIQ